MSPKEIMQWAIKGIEIGNVNAALELLKDAVRQYSVEEDEIKNETSEEERRMNKQDE